MVLVLSWPRHNAMTVLSKPAVRNRIAAVCLKTCRVVVCRPGSAGQSGRPVRRLVARQRTGPRPYPAIGAPIARYTSIEKSRLSSKTQEMALLSGYGAPADKE